MLVGEFDLLAINIFAFTDEWRFLFAENSELPRSKFKKYTEYQRQHLLASLVPVVYPPEPPLHDEPFALLDEIIAERESQGLPKPIVIGSADADGEEITVTE